MLPFYPVYLLLGTNIGDLSQNLITAHQLLVSDDIQIVKSSTIYQTAPWGVTDQPDFLNQALEITTNFTPFQFLNVIQNIENQMGRVKTRKWGERIIDIDILAFESQVIKTEILTIPHPQAHLRDFTMIPWKEIAPNFIHPTLLERLIDLPNQVK
jgi:2-amino-4-hydroxy-6-hydroxymethyldihydropteridine diphosphokinase